MTALPSIHVGKCEQMGGTHERILRNHSQKPDPEAADSQEYNATVLAKMLSTFVCVLETVHLCSVS